MQAQAKKATLPNPCRSTVAALLEPLTGRREPREGNASAGMVAAVGGGEPSKLPS
jgi:hypothetical protein